MMCEKVISSVVRRDMKPLQNNLYDVVKVEPAKPITPRNKKEYQCSFVPNTSKIYEPKRKSKFTKVKTVRDIRKLFETDILTDLSKELEKQESVLLKRITAGSSREGPTKSLAKSILKCDKPVSRTSWQMIMTLNPEDRPHAIQYALWNGKRIRINGSKGGKNKFICNYDLGSKKFKNASIHKKKLPKKKYLLQDSLQVRFKPGPLSKKQNLDESYQKYNVGNTNLVNLPKPSLDIYPRYGITFDPIIANFVQSLRDPRGIITEKWAEFSLSMLGTANHSGPIQYKENCDVTFELDYKLYQHRVLMRRDYESDSLKSSPTEKINEIQTNKEEMIESEVDIILQKMLDSIEINLKQDSMFITDDEPRGETLSTNTNCAVAVSKDKNRKRYCELDRLDVTIIRLPETSRSENLILCEKSHCTLGCICSSINCKYTFTQHCGRVECMFECKCDFSKYKAVDSFNSECPELLPGLINLDNELNLKLAKEEQKFHQTVVVTGDRSIVLKPERRNWKTSKRYGDFFSNMCLKNDSKPSQTLSILSTKLNCSNVEPWCMVHNLYKCFCKGKFTYPVSIQKTDIDNKVSETICQKEELSSSVNKEAVKNNACSDTMKQRTMSEVDLVDDSSMGSIGQDDRQTCARIKPYRKRKYSNRYYKTMNQKILELEKNDVGLRKKMSSIINSFYKDDDRNITTNLDTSTPLQTCKNNKASRVHSLSETGGRSPALEEKPNITTNLDTSTPLQTCKNNKASRVHSLSETGGRSPALEEKPNITTNLDTSTPLQTCKNNKASRVHSLSETGGRSSALEEKPKEVKNGLRINISANSAKNINMNDSGENKSVLNSANQTRLISWLEASYKVYKEREKNKTLKAKLCLEPPKHGKVALYPWEFILNRYRERKNIFMVTKEKPYRIFMCIDIKHNLFRNCINIDDIRFNDLHKYPATIKNLLTNASYLKENFNILCGLDICWELIGSVTKVCKSDESYMQPEEFNDEQRLIYEHEEESCNSALSDNINAEIISDEQPKIEKEIEAKGLTYNNAESSKWFIMTIENDFTEIQFHNKGFFVKYESIIRAIHVATVSRKTVRLSSLKKDGDNINDPQFGIYAIPNTNENYVLVGPYDKDEPLGIETVKSFSGATNTKKTRGVWITTNKVDNVKILDNPLLFISPKDVERYENITNKNENKPLDSKLDKIENESGSTDTSKETSKPINSDKSVTKTIKPIRIRRSNGFYHLAPKFNTTLKKICNTEDRDSSVSLLKTVPKCKKKPTMVVVPLKPKQDIEALPNSDESGSLGIKIVDVFSQSNLLQETTGTNKKTDCSMFILKPEEINKRLMESKLTPNVTTSLCSDMEMTQDIEHFISSTKCEIEPHVDTSLMISDDDTDDSMSHADTASVTEVYIECKNSKHLGWVPGKLDTTNKISFQFPGFLFTEFYEKEVAFSKINQVLSRKIYVPKNFVLQWHVVENVKDLKVSHKLTSEDLGPDLVLTKKGLRHRKELLELRNLKSNATVDEHPILRQSNLQNDSDEELERESSKLDEENFVMLYKLTSEGKILKNVNEMSEDDRQELTQTLKTFISDSTGSDSEETA